MKQFGYQSYKYSGDLYKFVIKQTGAEQVVEYYLADKIVLNASVDDSQRLTIKTDEAIQIGSLIANIVDAYGTPILDDIVWQITNISPALNAFNKIEGYRLRAVKYQGEI